jgi:hypothetical protein
MTKRNIKDTFFSKWEDYVPFSLYDCNSEKVGEFDFTDLDQIKSLMDVISYAMDLMWEEQNCDDYTHLHKGGKTMVRLINTIEKLQDAGVLDLYEEVA